MPLIADGGFLICAASLRSSLLAAASAASLVLTPAVALAQDTAPPGPKLPAMPSLAHDDTGEMAKPAGLTPPPPAKPPEPPKPKVEEKKKPEPAKKGSEKKGGEKKGGEKKGGEKKGSETKGGGKAEAKKGKAPGKPAARGAKHVVAPRAGRPPAAKPHAAVRGKKRR